jgi:hypothetical protein
MDAVNAPVNTLALCVQKKGCAVLLALHCTQYKTLFQRGLKKFSLRRYYNKKWPECTI